MITLNSRRTYMLKQLLEDNQPLKIDKLARKLESSQRTIRYDLDIVDAWLKKHNLDLLVRKHTDGIHYYYNRSIKEKILEQLSQLTIQEYEFDRKERVELICLVLLTTNKVTTISRLQDFFLMSRSSIILDLDQVEQELKHYSILLKRKPRKGVWVEGTEINIRQKLIQLHKSINQQTLQVFVNENGINNRTLKDMEFSPSLSGIIDELQFKKIQN